MSDDEDIIKIIGEIKCPKEFRCYRSGKLCKARKYGVDSLLECLEDDSEACVFSFHFGGSYFCRCPLRVYIAKHLEK